MGAGDTWRDSRTGQGLAMLDSRAEMLAGLAGMLSQVRKSMSMYMSSD